MTSDSERLRNELTLLPALFVLEELKLLLALLFLQLLLQTVLLHLPLMLQELLLMLEGQKLLLMLMKETHAQVNSCSGYSSGTRTVFVRCQDHNQQAAIHDASPLSNKPVQMCIYII